MLPTSPDITEPQTIDRNRTNRRNMEPTYEELVEAIRLLLLSPSNGCGCPMCDFGKLRNPEKEHWHDCEWNNAKKLLERLTPLNIGDK
jgi:hypothetical protein